MGAGRRWGEEREADKNYNSIKTTTNIACICFQPCSLYAGAALELNPEPEHCPVARNTTWGFSITENVVVAASNQGATGQL